MLMAERRRLILEHVRRRGVVSLRDMASVLGTSEITVRRDLSALADEGLVNRTHGGAVLPHGLAHEPTYREKATQAAAEKAAIGKLAAHLIQAGDSVILGAGTTTLALARELRRLPELTVVTNSLLVADALLDASGIEVLLTGGTLRRSIHALVGPPAEHSLRGLRANQAFLSGNGLTAQRGLSTPNLMVAATDRALAAAAREVVVLADHTKIGRDTMCQTVPCSSMHMLVTDPASDPEELRAIGDYGVEIRIASPEQGREEEWVEPGVAG
ncbi:MAG: DeoR/GlpR transcriptional regulator [Chloroflexi bacterium]|nr:MAG: DeoR/GlpR transcriptional regulator [Chloroflexota bacterium]